MKKQLTSFILALAMVVAMLPVVGVDVWAEPLSSVSYVDENGVSQTVATATKVSSSDSTWNTGWYVVSGNITINNTVTVSGAVNLILCDGATLSVTAASNNNAGINVTGSNSLTIYGQSGSTGKLIAKGKDHAAGIGGNFQQTGSSIAIYGGEIISEGKNGGAGIGGGEEGHGANITIGGIASVSAIGGDKAAGIGGGRCGGSVEGTGYNITISGGNVTAQGGDGGAGIGGGYLGPGKNIVINGGTVSAICGNGGAGIGGGEGKKGTNITIEGNANVTAIGSAGAGIGGGAKEEGTEITISGSAIVYSKCDENKDGAGIGGGGTSNETEKGGTGSSITIGGKASVSAIGANGAGIGGGAKGNGTNIFIYGGVLFAKSSNGAGIGGGKSRNIDVGFGENGEGGNATNITISGGSITAEGGTNGIGRGNMDPDAENTSTASGILVKQILAIKAGSDKNSASDILNTGSDLASALDEKQYVTIIPPVVIAKIDNAEYYSVQSAINAATSGQTVKMIADSTENITIASTTNVALDLNGHVLKGTGSTSVIVNNGTLTIKDSDPSAVHYFEYATSAAWKITSNNAGAIDIDKITSTTAVGKIIKVCGGCITSGSALSGAGISNTKTLIINDGNIIGNTAYKVDGQEGGGGGICVHDGTATMNDGNVIGNYSGKGGGGVSIFGNSKFTFKNGTISYNYSGESGGGVNSNGTLTMNGGSITNNYAKDCGGGVYIGSGKYGVITGGSIERNCSISYGGGVQLDNDKGLTLGGIVKIQENESVAKVNNLGIKSGLTFYIDSSLSSMSKIGISIIEVPPFARMGEPKLCKGSFSANGTQSNSTAFFADNEPYEVKFVTDHLELKEKITWSISGSGSVTDPYIINSVASLGAFAEYVNRGNSCEGEYIKLSNNFSSVGAITTPAGTDSNPFCGVFDGNSKTVELNIDKSSENNIGLFGYISGAAAEIKNITVTGNVTGSGCVGGIVGTNKAGMVINCFAECSIKGSSPNSAGIVGNNESGTVKNCYSKGTIIGHTQVGGIVGKNNKGVVLNCFSTSNVKSTRTGDPCYVGGVAGENDGGRIENCYTAGITVAFAVVGNIVGRTMNEDIVQCCYATDSGLALSGQGAVSPSCITMSATQMMAKAGEADALVDKLNTYALANSLATWVVNDGVNGGLPTFGVIPSNNNPGSSSSQTTSRQRTITISKTKNGTVTTNVDTSYSDKTITLTVTANEGYELDTITVKNFLGQTIALTTVANGSKYTFVMPASYVTIDATFKTVKAPFVNPFVDVTSTDYYYDSVLWAAENEITSGIDETHFNPSAITNRAQMVTFLWRLAGSPVVNYIMPFKDVDEDSYYAEAVRWGASLGYVLGTTETTFSPDAKITRAQALTFLWRYNGSIQFANMTATGPAPSPFTDVSTNAYYYNAVLWAKSNKITEGTSETTFSPDKKCTRADVVTFMYRSENKK